MESGLITPPALIGTGPLMGVTSSYAVPPTAAVAPGSVLVCIARPKTARISLDL